MAPAAHAATRAVAPSGADSGSCLRKPCASLRYAADRSRPGDVVRVAAGTYGPQTVPAGARGVTFRGRRGAAVRSLDNHADGVTFDNLDVDAGFAVTAGFENHDAAGVTFRNARIGNVTDEKGALVSGADLTFDRVAFHDVRLTGPDVHNECVYAIGVPGLTVRNSTFRGCATMDLFFSYGSWWSPLPPPYGRVTLENNVFGHATMEEPGSWHYYSLYVGSTGPDGGALTDWVVRHNTFETAATVDPSSGSGSRWVGNLGDWNCVAGIRYHRNVGKRCARSDRRVTPASSSRTRRAPFGWVDPPNGDFRLRRGSPAVDAGDPSDAPRRDRTGVRRDARPDAGAHERRKQGRRGGRGAKRSLSKSGDPSIERARRTR